MIREKGECEVGLNRKESSHVLSVPLRRVLPAIVHVLSVPLRRVLPAIVHVLSVSLRRVLPAIVHVLSVPLRRVLPAIIHASSVPVRRVLPAIVLAATMLNGCGAARPSKYYQLTVPGEHKTAQAADPVPATILLGSLLASHLYREDRIVYSSAGEQMGTYEYQRWAEPPTEMIQDLLLRELRSSHHYKSVYGQRSAMSADFLIRGRLYDFREVSERNILAKVTFELEMREMKSGATVWTHYYSHDEPVAGKEVPAVVSALNRNVQSGVAEVLASLEQYFREHPVK